MTNKKITFTSGELQIELNKLGLATDISKKTFLTFINRLRMGGRIRAHSFNKRERKYLFDDSTLKILIEYFQERKKYYTKEYITVTELWERIKSQDFFINTKAYFDDFLYDLNNSGVVKGEKFEGKYFYNEREQSKIINALRERTVTEETIKNSYTLQEVAKILERSEPQISSLAKSGKIKNAIKINNRVFIPKNSIQEYLSNYKLSGKKAKLYVEVKDDANKAKEGNKVKEGNKAKRNRPRVYKPKITRDEGNNLVDLSNYLTTREISEQLNVHPTYINKRIKKGEIKSIYVNRQYYISIDEVNKLLSNLSEELEEYTKEKALRDLDCFFKGLMRTIKKESHELFVTWAKDKLLSTQARPNTIRDIYRYSINLYNFILPILSEKEIFELNESELKAIITQNKISQRTKKEFIGFYNRSLIKKGISLTPRIKVDDKVNRKHFLKNKEEKKIYPPETFKAYYDYVQEIDLHTESAVKNRFYSNMWLYVIMHLTNIWRGNDIIYELPNVDLDLVGINSFEFFKHNKLTTSQARTIVNDIYLKVEDKLANKNSQVLRFYLDPNLTMSFATAVAICELQRRKFDGTIWRTKKMLLGTFIHGKTVNSSGTEAHMGFFWKNPDLKVFKSLQMNRSTALYIFHHILEEDSSDSDLALEMTGRARSHLKKETTAIYVESVNNDGSINRVSLNLFNRGLFGWLYNYLIKLVMDDGHHYLEERTNLISETREVMSPIILEKWSGYLLNHYKKRQSFAVLLAKLPQDELLKLLYKIYKGEMPSKEKEGQCLAYPDCKHLTSKTCFGCEFFIPKQMVLIEVANEFRLRVKKLNDSSKYEAIRIRESLYISNLLLILDESIRFLGKETVETFIKVEEIKQLFTLVEDKLIDINYMDQIENKIKSDGLNKEIETVWS